MILISKFFEVSSKSCILFLKIILDAVTQDKKDYNSKTLLKYWNQKINMNITLISLAYFYLIAVCYGIYYIKNAILKVIQRPLNTFFFITETMEHFTMFIKSIHKKVWSRCYFILLITFQSNAFSLPIFLPQLLCLIPLVSNSVGNGKPIPRNSSSIHVPVYIQPY